MHLVDFMTSLESPSSPTQLLLDTAQEGLQGFPISTHGSLKAGPQTSALCFTLYLSACSKGPCSAYSLRHCFIVSFVPCRAEQLCQILFGAAEPCSLLRKVAAFDMHLEIGFIWLAVAC